LAGALPVKPRSFVFCHLSSVGNIGCPSKANDLPSTKDNRQTTNGRGLAGLRRPGPELMPPVERGFARFNRPGPEPLPPVERGFARFNRRFAAPAPLPAGLGFAKLPP